MQGWNIMNQTHVPNTEVGADQEGTSLRNSKGLKVRSIEKSRLPKCLRTWNNKEDLPCTKVFQRHEALLHWWLLRWTSTQNESSDCNWRECQTKMIFRAGESVSKRISYLGVFEVTVLWGQVSDILVHLCPFQKQPTCHRTASQKQRLALKPWIWQVQKKDEA